MPSSASVERIVRTTCEQFGVLRVELEGHQRQRSISVPRMLAMAISRRLTDLSFAQIGRMFGGRAHSTVLRDCRRMDTYVAAAAQVLPPEATPEAWVAAIETMLEAPRAGTGDQQPSDNVSL
jgi:chromosomal replication initiation ATPase DnaA